MDSRYRLTNDMEATYYIDQNAPDGGDGSKEKPFNKLSQLLEQLDTLPIILPEGTYNLKE